MEKSRKSYFLIFSLIVLVLISLLIADNFTTRGAAVKADEPEKPKEICKDYKKELQGLIKIIKGADLKNPEDHQADLDSLNNIATKATLTDEDLKSIGDIVQRLNLSGDSEEYFRTPSETSKAACQKEIKNCPTKPITTPVIPMMIPEMMSCPDPVAPKAPEIPADLSTFANNVINKFCLPSKEYPNAKGSGRKGSRSPAGSDFICNYGFALKSAIENFNNDPSLKNASVLLSKLTKTPNIELLPKSSQAIKDSKELLYAYGAELLKNIPGVDPKNNLICKPTPEQLKKYEDLRNNPPLVGSPDVPNDCKKIFTGASVIFQGNSAFGTTINGITGYLSSVVGYLPGGIKCDASFLNLDAYEAEITMGKDGKPVDSSPNTGYVSFSGESPYLCSIVKSLVPCTLVTRAWLEAEKAKNISFPFFGPNSDESNGFSGIIIGATPGQRIDPGKGGDPITIPGNPGKQIGGGITIGMTLSIKGGMVDSRSIRYLPNVPFGGLNHIDFGLPVFLTPTLNLRFPNGNPPQVRVSDIPNMCEIYTKVDGGIGNNPSTISPIAKPTDIPTEDSFTATLRTLFKGNPVEKNVTINKDADGKYYFSCKDEGPEKDGSGGDILIKINKPDDLINTCPDNIPKFLLGYPGTCKDGKREVILANENIPKLESE